MHHRLMGGDSICIAHTRVPIPDCVLPSRSRSMVDSRRPQTHVRLESIQESSLHFAQRDCIRWGGTPAVAMFASAARFKRESYRGSQFAPRVLADEGIPVIMKVITVYFSKKLCMKLMPWGKDGPSSYERSLPLVSSATSPLLWYAIR